ncbi:MAG: toxin-activating lysine-acyltransferase [Proteobacteria bacterium]|nr:toxin-activating lysine-acyltransferase [Pseudomonadota bacterium]
MDSAQLFGAVTELMAQSDLHCRWTVHDLHRLTAAPLQLGQFIAFFSAGQLTGWFTWANLTAEAEAGFIDGARKLQAWDWNGGDYSRVWIIDGLAPNGGMPRMARAVRRMLSEAAKAGNWPARHAKWLRRHDDSSLRHVGTTKGTFNER